MRPWVAAGGGFFLYVLVCAAVVPGLARRRRLLATVLSTAGLGLCALAHLLPDWPVVHTWILPPVLLLLAYWGSGLLFVAPMPRVERALAALDRALRIDRAAAAMPRWASELLELGYLGVYPLIPAALAIHLVASPAPGPDGFWTVILVTDFICFGFLPWVQTRPPRVLCAGDPWAARLRRVNLHLLGAAGIKANTFPSGHAAEALAAALLVSDASWPLAGGVAAAAVLVPAGAVLGRYHYAADAFAGWIVAAFVWALAPVARSCC